MKKILLAEDDSVLREMYRLKLKNHGFGVITASDGAEALAIAMSQRPDLVILDVKMPRLTGLEVMQKLRANSWGKDVLIIILTAFDTTEAALKQIATEHPAYYLVKDRITPDELMEKVKELLKD